MHVLAITQARMGSTRLPGKVFKTLGGQPLLKVHLDRVAAAHQVDRVIVATTNKAADEAIALEASNWGFDTFRGSENDVLERFYLAAKPSSPEWVVRVTSDCPFVDPELIDEVISLAVESDVDYCSNTLIEAYPDGQDIEVFRFAALERAHREATLASDREHVTPYIKRNSDFNGGTLFKAMNLASDVDYNQVRLCVDEPIDLEVARKLAEICGLTAGWKKYTETYLNNESIKVLNQNILRNEGYFKSLGEDEATD